MGSTVPWSLLELATRRSGERASCVNRVPNVKKIQMVDMTILGSAWKKDGTCRYLGRVPLGSLQDDGYLIFRRRLSL